MSFDFEKKLRTHNEPSLFQRCRVPSPLHALICVHTSKQAGFTSEQFGHPDSRKKVAWNTFSPRGIASGLQVPVNVSSVDKADEVWHPLLVCRKNRAVHHDWNHKSSENCTFCGCWMMVIPCDTMWYHVIPCDTMWYHVIPSNQKTCHVLQLKKIRRSWQVRRKESPRPNGPLGSAVEPLENRELLGRS